MGLRLPTNSEWQTDGVKATPSSRRLRKGGSGDFFFLFCSGWAIWKQVVRIKVPPFSVDRLVVLHKRRCKGGSENDQPSRGVGKRVFLVCRGM